MNPIQRNFEHVYKKIYTIAHNFNRDPSKITLVAVSKTKPVTTILEAINTGHRSFGESYAQEAIKKIVWLRDKRKIKDLIWHFIGHVQINKSRLIAENFDWCHTVDRKKIVENLNEKRLKNLIPLNVLIQINISGEITKGGILPDEMFKLAEFISKCPALCLRGLMAIPFKTNIFQDQLSSFNRMNTLYKNLQSIYPTIDTLSLGMTGDMSAAIAAGSSLLRIGTAIFGER
ncbi:pyridoxal phosphate enzyme, YggS family [secondary endosymbiont of Heteropsylla cubana]|uniref:Pyridoxal phosphate homeostasis protein n=1 Tax=secondary endosymbiont of Heteropsylla cubana TaxID=134287 RepID=J3TYK6_9ENTR|nr:YggS family pyridoxal phosphate-dependent enzyme [secondary endosymbiont of Heteropsylla cubana]AFP85475.1 pyridoxal phosphate enzyme, YggS family [secondary endosymbiont of Heteropsylla cubana]